MLITFDIEDYYKNFCKFNLNKEVKHNKLFLQKTLILSKELRKNKISAIFFILGDIIELFPDIVKKIINDGHQIGVHGYNHTLINGFNKINFKQDLVMCQNSLKKINKDFKINYYRSPAFSMMSNIQDYYDVLNDMDIRFSSSFTLNNYTNIKNEINFGKVKEIPLISIDFIFFNFKFTGGSFFRITPYFILKFLINFYRNKEKELVFYFHPYDFFYKYYLDPFKYSKISKTKYLKYYFKNMFYNFNLKKNNIKFKKFLQNYIINS